jgi:thiamine biosynthesis protein ThiS
MTLKVNGEEYVTEKDTVAELLKEMGVVPERVAVEVNMTVIKKSAFGNFRLKEGDSVEIVYFVGGGQNKKPAKSMQDGCAPKFLEAMIY